MKVEKIKEHITAIITGDSTGLGRLARDLGHEFSRKRLETINEFRAELADQMPPEGRYLRNSMVEHGRVVGYLEALLEIAAAYSDAILPEHQDEGSLTSLREKWLEPVMLALLSSPFASLNMLEKLVPTFESSSEQISREKIVEDLLLLQSSHLVSATAGDEPSYSLTLHGERLAERLLFESQK